MTLPLVSMLMYAVLDMNDNVNESKKEKEPSGISGSLCLMDSHVVCDFPLDKFLFIQNQW